LSKDVKAVVIACNTASAAAMDFLRAEFDLPVLGVIEAGVEEAIRRAPSGRIGVIGTSATIQSGKYERLLRKNGITKVISAACPLFVPLAEEGWTDNKVAEDVARIYLEPFTNNSVDALILGCTHYPLLEKVIAKICGDGVALINSASAIAVKLKEQLSATGLQNDGGGERRYYFTDSIERAREVGSRFLGENMDNRIQSADLTEFTNPI
jgi:glutamate racemase